MKIRTLIVDDEPLAREWVRNGLQEEADVEIVAECGDGFEAVKAVADLKPDLLILDVQMPGLDGFGVLAALEPSDLPAVIFVTAFDRYALKAFEAHAVDYLMKPFSPERLHDAVERARAEIDRTSQRDLKATLHALLEDIQRERAFPEWLLIKKEDRSVFLRVADIDWIESSRNNVRLHVGKDIYVFHETTSGIEAKLDPKILPHPPLHDREHREDQGDAPWFNGDYAVTLKDGTKLTLSSTYRERLKEFGGSPCSRVNASVLRASAWRVSGATPTDRIRRRRYAREIFFLWTGVGSSSPRSATCAHRPCSSRSRTSVEVDRGKPPDGVHLGGSDAGRHGGGAPVPAAPGTVLRSVPLLILAGAAAALIHLTVTNVFWYAVAPAARPGDFAAMFLATLAFGGAARLATFFGLVGVTWGIDDDRTYREKALEASEIERELVQTQLEALKLRLHPPFLFNALAAILPLIRTDPRVAARTVVQLGDILRLALHNDATGLVPLKTELEYIRLYLQIEQTRLRDRLEVSFTIDPGALQAAVPNLILLPLIESAIANGVSVRPGKAHIRIQAWPDADELRVAVHEGPAEPTESAVPVELDDAFVRKTKMRLELLYPGQHLVAMSDKLEKGHELQLTIPLASPMAAAIPVQGVA